MKSDGMYTNSEFDQSRLILKWLIKHNLGLIATHYIYMNNVDRYIHVESAV